MRTVSFSNDRVQDVLNNQFVCCYSNTQGDPSAGASFSHAPSDQPGPCARGAGRQNVQTIFMTPAGQIFHVASGYLEPKDLLDEAAFASRLYADLQRRGARGAQTVVAAHRQRLEQLGFSSQQIAAPPDRLSEMMLSGPNPQDFGIQLPTAQDLGVNFGGPAGNLFGDISRQRILKDHRFVMANPLIKQQSFQDNPESLVGHHASFFGSHAAMSGITEQINGSFRNSGLSRRRR